MPDGQGRSQRAGWCALGEASLTWKRDFVGGALLQQQTVAAVEKEHTERAVQAARRLARHKAVAVIFVCRPHYDIMLVHHDAIVSRHDVRLAAMP